MRSSDSDLSLESTVHLLLDPVSTLGLVGLNIDIVYKCADVGQLVQIREQLLHIVGDLLLVTVLQTQALLVKLADPVDAF